MSHNSFVWLLFGVVLLIAAFVFPNKDRSMPDPLGRLGRQQLIDEIKRLQRDCETYLDNLTATQIRCTELIQENRRLKRIDEATQWICEAALFNGEKEIEAPWYRRVRVTSMLSPIEWPTATTSEMVTRLELRNQSGTLLFWNNFLPPLFSTPGDRFIAQITLS